MTQQPSTHELLLQVAGDDSRDLRWTEDLADRAIPEHDVAVVTDRALALLGAEHLTFPDQDVLVRRCVSALLAGHLVLQGPPGSGKTSLARVLTYAFHMELKVCTATSEWSPFHVMGGLRPNVDGGLEAVLGEVPSAALACAQTIRDLEGGAGQSPDDDEAAVGTWLLIDEFNRADIDKAIGSLYTLLSSTEPAHLQRTPLDLWFETDEARKRLWVPSRFRIIGTMNDLDTSYVSAMSQGLRRRFQFITVGIPASGATESEPISVELRQALAVANNSLFQSYQRSAVSEADLQDALVKLQRVIDGLRRPADVIGWPVGTAQVVDVIKALILVSLDGDLSALDEAVAHRLVGQLSTISKAQHDVFGGLLRAEGLDLAATELDHVYQPYAVV